MNKLATMILISAVCILQAACQLPSKTGRSTKDDSEDQRPEEKGVSFADGQLTKQMEIKFGQTDTILLLSMQLIPSG